MKVVTKVSLSKWDVEPQTHSALSAVNSLAMWAPFFFLQGFYSVMSEHDLNVIAIVWLAIQEEHVVPFYCFTIFVS